MHVATHSDEILLSAVVFVFSQVRYLLLLTRKVTALSRRLDRNIPS
jgi:hypothetical protein